MQLNLHFNTGKVNVYGSFATSLAATATNMPYVITQCFLQPGRSDILMLDLATPEGCKAELT